MSLRAPKEDCQQVMRIQSVADLDTCRQHVPPLTIRAVDQPGVPSSSCWHMKQMRGFTGPGAGGGTAGGSAGGSAAGPAGGSIS